MTRGKLIAIEGLDCSFKETNSKALYEYLVRKHGSFSVALCAFPRYNNSASYLVRQYLYGKYGKPEKLDHSTVSSFYMLDMFDFMMCEGKKFLENGGILVLDRYWYSNIFYRLGAHYLANNNELHPISKKAIIESISTLAKELDLPKADLIIKLKTDENVMIDYVKQKNSGDLHESNEAFLRAIHKQFDSISLGEFANEGLAVDIHVTENGKVLPKDVIRRKIINAYDVNIGGFIE